MLRCSQTLVVFCALVVGSGVARGQVVNQWDFGGDLGPTLGSNALEGVALDGSPVIGFASEMIGGEAADVATFADGTAFLVRHDALPNGGGGYVNQYTIVMDVRIDEGGSDWVCLYQTTDCSDGATANPLMCSNDGDAFINPTGGIGISGDYGGTMTAGWHRVAIAVDLTVPVMNLYIDGAFVNDVSLSSGLDGRWALYGPGDPDVFDYFFLFADESGVSEMGMGAINSFQFRDVAMSAEAIGALGGPTAAGIPLPLPPVEVPLASGWAVVALALLLVGAGQVAIARHRRRVAVA